MCSTISLGFSCPWWPLCPRLSKCGDLFPSGLSDSSLAFIFQLCHTVAPSGLEDSSACINQAPFVRTATDSSGTAGDFCQWQTLTAEDTFGRFETDLVVTASNLFKYCQPCHGLVIFKHHDPLYFTGMFTGPLVSFLLFLLMAAEKGSGSLMLPVSTVQAVRNPNLVACISQGDSLCTASVGLVPKSPTIPVHWLCALLDASGAAVVWLLSKLPQVLL